MLTAKEEKGLGMRAEDVDGNNYFLGSAKHKTPDHFNLTLYRNQVRMAQIAVDDTIKPNAARPDSPIKKSRYYTCTGKWG
jgi:Cu+-exporting ATPase